MNKTVAYTDAEFAEALNNASESYDPGKQPDIASLMRAAYVHGYADALLKAKRETGPTREED